MKIYIIIPDERPLAELTVTSRPNLEQVTINHKNLLSFLKTHNVYQDLVAGHITSIFLKKCHKKDMYKT